MEFFLHRATSLATASIPLPTRERSAAHAPDRPAMRASFTARALLRWVLWLALLILPGSLVLVPVVIWWRSRQGATVRGGLSTNSWIRLFRVDPLLQPHNAKIRKLLVFANHVGVRESGQ